MQLKRLAPCLAQGYLYPLLAVVVGKIKSFHLEKNKGREHVKPVVQIPYRNHCWFLTTSHSGMFRCSFAPHFSGKAFSLPFPTGMFTLTYPLTQRPGASGVLGKHTSYKLKITWLNGDDAGGQVGPCQSFRTLRCCDLSSSSSSLAHCLLFPEVL